MSDKELEILVGGVSFLARLNDTETAKRLLKALPLRGDGARWGDEIYFDVGIDLPAENPKEEVEVGDVAYWHPGTAICLFYGRTPASTSDRPRAASPVTVVGRLQAGVEKLRHVPSLRGIELRRAGPSKAP